ncbi:phage terminase large subunit [Limobrevibacterium gyesilva]|uniref:Phage terminase large subunit n=1 Tax=Limobrevibacterium gyesilva TaxID=2991712 RepID=A0AA42CFB8_9PROT|nr:phage terminase large subunit [Limobrevibacterium gyesilva]MCW3476404.1 phage terminase large subunit [Limobrevibacterium gyesilva]
MSDRRSLLRALLRQDLPSFTAKCFATLEAGRPFHGNWHIRHIGWQLSRVASGEVKRLALTIPPRHLKSICVTVAYTAWAVGHAPSLKVITVSYADELAKLHAAAFRTVVESDWYRALFPAYRISRATQTEVETTAGGIRYAGSVGGSILGRGADLIVVDDPIKAQAALSAAERRKVKEFYDNTLYTHLNDKGRGAIVIVMQRLHQDDLVGHVLGQEPWELAAIPAIETEDRSYRLGPEPGEMHHRRVGEVIDCRREDRAVLDQLRRTLGSMNFAAQYQQDPVPPDGNAIRREWLRFYDTLPSQLDLVVVSWDTASTLGEASDWSVSTVWGLRGSDIFLLDVVRGRFEVPELRRRIEATTQRYGADATLVEETDIGRAVVQEMRQSSPVRPILWRPLLDKEARLLAQAPKFEAGQVLLPREAPWLAEYASELLAFPNGTHDDQVDSTSQALNWLSRRIAIGTPPARPNPRRPTGPVRRASGEAKEG